MKHVPALELVAHGDMLSDEDEGLLLAFLDDFPITAIDDDGRAWRVFFATDAARTVARDALARSVWGGRLALTDLDVPDEPWAERSQASIGSRRVGNVVVTPPWLEASARRSDGSALVVVIEPSMGFGTGHHESTRLCLEALQTLDLAGRSVIDVGTGSGVLAITAALCGCAHAVAIDSDPDAIDAAHANVRLNGVSDRVELRCTDLTAASIEPADVVFANLTGALLRHETDHLTRLVVQGGRLVLSGFTEEESLAVRHEYGDLTLERESSEAGWTAFVFRT
jgi:ribosomal protein L11 methyltransferase